MIDISVIIPFYNSGNYILDALESISQYQGSHSIEVIIVDDGSFDVASLAVLSNLSKTYNVLTQKNKGPATARNNGCAAAKGRYFLFLDSDNKINPAYIDKSVDILENHADIGVVYAKPSFFGEDINRCFDTYSFDIKKLLLDNYIDTCAFVRKEVWQSVNGFDDSPEMFTCEDWDFWLSVYEYGWKFHFIEEELFFYRIRKDSLMGNHLQKKEYLIRNQYIFKKHIRLYQTHYRFIIDNAIENFRRESRRYQLGNIVLKPLLYFKKKG